MEKSFAIADCVASIGARAVEEGTISYQADLTFRTRQAENPCSQFTKNAPTGILHGQALGAYKNSLLDYTYNNMNDTLMVAAHVSCCNYPEGWQLKTLWQENMKSLMDFLHTTHQ
ncbi:hypothetical protein C7M84_007354, partial [Penaeus vannamei]